jgi:hypothetical protein
VTSIAVWIASAALVLAGAAHLWTRRTRAARGDAIQLVATRHLGAKRFLAIVELEGEFLLVSLDRRQANLALALHQMQAFESQIIA